MSASSRRRAARVRRDRCRGQSTVIKAADERRPASPHVAEGGGEFGFARQLAGSLFGPGGERLGDGLRPLLSFSSSTVGAKPLIVSSTP